MFENARFLASSNTVSRLPLAIRAEVALVGRSNSGKSSAINALTGRKALARVSRTPGRTRQINLFEIEPGMALADLPGYGYARAPAHLRNGWHSMVTEYLHGRPQLIGLVLVMDARHPLTPLDRQLLEWLQPAGKPVHALLTKSDRLSQAEAARVLNSLGPKLAAFDLPISAQLFSSRTRLGVEEARQRIRDWLASGTGQAPGIRTMQRKTPG